MSYVHHTTTIDHLEMIRQMEEKEKQENAAGSDTEHRTTQLLARGVPNPFSISRHVVKPAAKILAVTALMIMVMCVAVSIFARYSSGTSE